MAPEVRLIVIPATQAVYKQAMAEGLIDSFIDAGGAVSTPMAKAACLAAHSTLPDGWTQGFLRILGGLPIVLGVMAVASVAAACASLPIRATPRA